MNQVTRLDGLGSGFRTTTQIFQMNQREVRHHQAKEQNRMNDFRKLGAAIALAGFSAHQLSDGFSKFGRVANRAMKLKPQSPKRTKAKAARRARKINRRKQG